MRRKGFALANICVRCSAGFAATEFVDQHRTLLTPPLQCTYASQTSHKTQMHGESSQIWSRSVRACMLWYPLDFSQPWRAFLCIESFVLCSLVLQRKDIVYKYFTLSKFIANISSTQWSSPFLRGAVGSRFRHRDVDIYRTG